MLARVICACLVHSSGLQHTSRIRLITFRYLLVLHCCRNVGHTLWLVKFLVCNWFNFFSVNIRVNCCFLLGILDTIIQTLWVELFNLHTTLMPSVDLFDILTWVFSIISVKLFYNGDMVCSVIWIDKFAGHLMRYMFRASRLVLMLNVNGILIALCALLSMSFWRELFVYLAQISWKLMWRTLFRLFMSINWVINVTEVISVLSMLRCSNFYYSLSFAINLRRIWLPIIRNIAPALTNCAYNTTMWMNRICTGLVGVRLIC